jgi:hypothetical protein
MAWRFALKMVRARSSSIFLLETHPARAEGVGSAVQRRDMWGEHGCHQTNSDRFNEFSVSALGL